MGMQPAAAVRKDDIHPRFQYINRELALNITWSYANCEGKGLPELASIVTGEPSEKNSSNL